MPRITAPDAQNELRIDDAISGDVITLYYRLPTTEERTKYSRGLFTRERNKVKSTVAEARQKWGKAIMTGFKDGDFARVVDGRKVFYSSDPASPDYDPKWKETICTWASDLVEFLALTVFEGNTREIDNLPDDDEAGIIEEVTEKNL